MADADDLVRALLSRRPHLGSTRLLAIDGPAGAGKSTLAGALGPLLTEVGYVTRTVRLDDLYDGWSGLDRSLERRVLAQVLDPLRESRPARWQVYDWAAGQFASWHTISPPSVLVLEGCGAGARSFSPYTSLLVWVETTPAVALSRMVARDGPDVVAHLPGWRRSELRHFTDNDTRSRADVLLTT